MVLGKNLGILENVENLQVRKRCAVPELSSPKDEPLR